MPVKATKRPPVSFLIFSSQSFLLTFFSQPLISALNADFIELFENILYLHGGFFRGIFVHD